MSAGPPNTARMRALRSDGAATAIDPRCEAPAPAPGLAVVRATRVALCDTDADLVRRAPAPAAPFTPGAEFVGVVERLHESADKPERDRLLGKRVVGSPIIVCGACDLCRAGLSTHCRARRVLGRTGWDGALAERFALPTRNLTPVPHGVDDDRAVFAVALAAAVHAGQVVRVEGKPFVTVLGDTVEGLLTAQVMARLNASVRVLGSRPDRLDLCEKWGGGIKHRPIDDAGRRQDQDVVIECTGTPAGFAAALKFVRPRGTVVLVRPIGVADLAPAVEHEITLVGSRAGPIPEALALLARSAVDVVGLIGRRFKFAEAPAAMAAAAEPGALRTIVEM